MAYDLKVNDKLTVPEPDDNGLTFKQKVFVKEYAENGGNGSAAAKIAYSVNGDRSARACAADALTKPPVRKAILLELERLGVSDVYLAKKHKHFLGLARRKGIPEKSLGFKALNLAYRLRGDISDEPQTHSATLPAPQLTVLVQVLNELKPQLDASSVAAIADESKSP